MYASKLSLNLVIAASLFVSLNFTAVFSWPNLERRTLYVATCSSEIWIWWYLKTEYRWATAEYSFSNADIFEESALKKVKCSKNSSIPVGSQSSFCNDDSTTWNHSHINYNHVMIFHYCRRLITLFQISNLHNYNFRKKWRHRLDILNIFKILGY